MTGADGVPAPRGPRGGARRPTASVADRPPTPRVYRRPEFLSPSTTPPPAVVGPNVVPYPDALAGRWADGEWPRDAGSMSLPSAAVGLRGVGTGPLATRQPDGRWAVDPALADALWSRAEAVGYRGSAGVQAVHRGWFVRALETRLNAFAWYHPDAFPPLSGFVAELCGVVLAPARADALDPEQRVTLTGETFEALGVRRSTPDYPFGDDVTWSPHARAPQDWIDRAVAGTGRVSAYRLRPLVVGSANAAHREVLYRGWGVYDAPRGWDGPPGRLLAIYGKEVGVTRESWHAIGIDRLDRGEAAGAWRRDPRFTGVRWNGPDFSHWARIHCAITGALLYEHGTPCAAAAVADPATCVSRLPAFPDGRDFDVVYATRRGPAGPP